MPMVGRKVSFDSAPRPSTGPSSARRSAPGRGARASRSSSVMASAAARCSTVSVMKLCAPIRFCGVSANSSAPAVAPAAPATGRRPNQMIGSGSRVRTAAAMRSAVGAWSQKVAAIGRPIRRSPGGSQRFCRKIASRKAGRLPWRSSSASLMELFWCITSSQEVSSGLRCSQSMAMPASVTTVASRARCNSHPGQAGCRTVQCCHRRQYIPLRNQEIGRVGSADTVPHGEAKSLRRHGFHPVPPESRKCEPLQNGYW